MSTDTINYGIPNGQLKWEQGFTAHRNDKNEWEGKESFQCLKKDLTTLIPLKGAPCQYPGFSFMTATEVDVENLAGGFDRVTVKFAGVGAPGDFTFEDDNLDDPEFDKYNYELSITTQENPIETHPKFRNLTKEDREIITNIINGNLTRSQKKSGGVLSEPYKFSQKSEEGGQVFEISADTDARKLVDYLMNGVTSFLRAIQIWRVKFNSPSLPPSSILNHVGKIATAKGAPAVSENRNWLFVGIDASFADGMCATTYEWHLSEVGGWETYLYS